MLPSLRTAAHHRSTLGGEACRNRWSRSEKPRSRRSGGQPNKWWRIGSSTTSIGAVEETTFELSDGMKIEVLKQNPAKESDRPPVVFVHGACHGAWCWKEYFMPYFAEAGYPVCAISVRGQGNSDLGDLKVSGTLGSHADDLSSFIATFERPPVLIGHSFGGLLVQKCSTSEDFPPISGVATLCSAPPSGNSEMVVRFLKRDLFFHLKVTWSLATRSFKKNINDCRTMFFSESLSNDDLERFHLQIQKCSPLLYADLAKMQQEVPLEKDDQFSLPAFVLGAEDDVLVDQEAIEETAAFFNTSDCVTISGMAHDCMLDTKWREAAQPLKNWLDGI